MRLLWGIIFAKPDNAVLEQFRDSQLVENNVNVALYCFLNSNQKKTGCDEYVDDQLNIASKNLPKYPFHEKYGKKYLEDICSMNGWSDKNSILSFFSPQQPNCSTHQISYLSDPRSRFLQITSQIFDKSCEIKYSFKN